MALTWHDVATNLFFFTQEKSEVSWFQVLQELFSNTDYKGQLGYASLNYINLGFS